MAAMTSTGKRATLTRAFRAMLTYRGIEPLPVLIEAGAAFKRLFLAELIRRQVCRDLHYSADVCANLTAHHKASIDVGIHWSEMNAIGKSEIFPVGKLRERSYGRSGDVTDRRHWSTPHATLSYHTPHSI